MHVITESEYSTHSMIALYPDAGLAATLAVDGGLAAGDLHCTIVYTGRVDAVDEAALRAAVEDLLGRDPIEATINGVARFAGAGDDPDALVLLVDSPALEVLRRDALTALAEHGVDPPLSHGFTAHITVAYIPADADAPLTRIDPTPATFTTLAMKWGDERTEYPLAGVSPAEAARRAYAAGWAASGGPLTERVRAGAVAAVELAETSPGPGVLEATLRLGHLEGTWALIFERRDALHDQALTDVQKAWAKLVDQVDMDTAVADAEDAAAGRADDAEVRAALVLSITGYVLAALRALTATPTWEQLRRVIRDAIAAAHAEGAANVAALGADADGAAAGGFDHDAAHADAASAIDDDRDDTWSAADVALHAGLAAAAAAVARRVVRTFFDDGTTADLLRDAIATLAAGDAIATEVRHAVDKAFAASMWNLYRLAGLDMVDLVTVGDGRVCAGCIRAEEAGPYSLFDAPILPLHFGCRCVLEPNGKLPASLFAVYLIGGG